MGTFSGWKDNIGEVERGDSLKGGQKRGYLKGERISTLHELCIEKKHSPKLD